MFERGPTKIKFVCLENVNSVGNTTLFLRRKSAVRARSGGGPTPIKPRHQNDDATNVGAFTTSAKGLNICIPKRGGLGCWHTTNDGAKPPGSKKKALSGGGFWAGCAVGTWVFKASGVLSVGVQKRSSGDTWREHGSPGKRPHKKCPFRNRGKMT